jgi:hypothetical protein
VAHPAAAGARGILAAHLVRAARRAAALARARVEAARAGSPLVANVGPAGNAILFGGPLTALSLDRFASGHRLADLANAGAIAGLLAFLVASAAHFLDAALGHGAAGRAAHLFVAGLDDRLANGVAALTAMLFAEGLLAAVARLVAVLLVDRLANGVAALFPAALRHAFANRVVALFPAGLVAGLAAGLHAGLVARLVARFVAGLALFAIASLANRLHHSFLHGLVAGVPPLLQDRVVHQLVTGAALLLTSSEAALGIAARVRTAGVLGGAAIRRGRVLDSPEQADHRSQQRHSQAHPHDLASSSAYGPVVVNSSTRVRLYVTPIRYRSGWLPRLTQIPPSSGLDSVD